MVFYKKMQAILASFGSQQHISSTSLSRRLFRLTTIATSQSS